MIPSDLCLCRIPLARGGQRGARRLEAVARILVGPDSCLAQGGSSGDAVREGTR